MKKRVKGLCTLLLAGALAATLLPGLPSARAAVAVDTTKEDCSIDVKVSVEDTYAGLKELRDEAVTVDLYKVADISASGKYTATGVFSGMKFDYIEYDADASDGETSASKWNQLAAEAAQCVTDETKKADTIVIAGKTETEAGKTEGTSKDLGVGLYLIVPKTVTTDYFVYTFAPSLVSLPNNYYYTKGSDDWVYNLTGTNAITLKPEQTERLGNLDIKKSLTNWSSTAGKNAMFIFEISYTSLKGKTETWQEVMNFTGTGDETINIKNIPAGSTVTVKEVYSGAAYTLTGLTGKRNGEEVASVVDEDGLLTLSMEVVADETVTATAVNTHDGTPDGGSGVINHFELQGTEGAEQYQVDEQQNGSTTGRTVVERTETAEKTE